MVVKHQTRSCISKSSFFRKSLKPGFEKVVRAFSKIKYLILWVITVVLPVSGSRNDLKGGPFPVFYLL